jgi:hypothetical protein
MTLVNLPSSKKIICTFSVERRFAWSNPAGRFALEPDSLKETVLEPTQLEEDEHGTAEQSGHLETVAADVLCTWKSLAC